MNTQDGVKYAAEYALDVFIVYSFDGHKRDHCAQMAVFRDGLDQPSVA